MSEERVSALEQTIRDKAQFDATGIRTDDIPGWQIGSSSAYLNAADLVHERDRQLRALLDTWNIIANPPEDENWRYGMTTDEERMAYAECIREIRAILEGKTC